MAELGIGAMPFANAWSALDRSIPIGFWTHDNQLEITPNANAIVGANDRLIVISEDDSTIVAKAASPADHPAASNKTILRQLDTENTAAQRVLLIGISASHSFIFDKLIQAGTGVKQLTVCLPDNELGKAVKRDLAQRKATKVKFIMAKTDGPADLARLKPDKFDAIIVSHTALPQTGGTDVQTIKSIQILRTLLAKNLADVHLIAEMLEGKNRDILSYELDSDFVVSEKIGSKVFAQYIENPTLRHVVDKLICSQSHHIKLYPVNAGKTSLTISFGDIGRGLLIKQKILIGWTYYIDGSRVSVVNPDADSTLPTGCQRLNLIVVERQ